MAIYFYIGKNNKIENLPDDSKRLDFIKGKFSELLGVKNLSFLLGAGCSSFKDKDGNEIGIPAMSDLAELFLSGADVDTKQKITEYHKGKITNLESFLGYLYRKYQSAKDEENNVGETSYENAIKHTKNFILEKCKSTGKEIAETYKNFYRKLLLRAGNLPRANILTTNYDLNNEVALDDLGIVYSNGFSGFIDRRFNPAVFKYGFYTEMDIKGRQLTQIDHFIYLYKLHGSVNWVRKDNGQRIFDIREEQVIDKANSLNVMIYPTPQKQEDSFGVPYSDMFREFQNKISQANSVLICVGYGFNDDHVNNIIFRSLTLPTFRLVILGDADKDTIKRLRELDDSRIWVIGGDHSGGKIHYFKGFVDQILPDIEQEKMDQQIRKTEEGLLNITRLKEELK